MPQQPIDYAALAAQAKRETPVDYAALAEQARGKKTVPTSPQTSEAWLREHGAMPGLGTTALGMVGDAARGGLAGAASTVYHTGDLIRRGLGMERIIDQTESQRAMTPPPTMSGGAGKLIEQALEFIYPLSKISAGVKGAGMLTRMGAEALGSAGVAGAQSGGDLTSMALAAAGAALMPPAFVPAKVLGGAVQRAAAGASEGGLGGAIAAGVRTAAPGEPRAMLIQALKPRSTKVQFPSSLKLAMPELKAAEETIGAPITGVETLMDATKAAKQQIQEQLGTLRGAQRAIGAEVDLSPVADAMVASIPKKVALETPDVASRLLTSAQVYRRSFTLDEAEALLRETNAELDGFYAMYPQAQRGAVMSNPAVAALTAQAKSLRTAIYNTLDAPGQGAAARELNRRYGALLDVESEAYRRLNVAARQQPESLSEQIGAVRAAADMARGLWKVSHGNVAGAADIMAAHAGRSAAKSIKESQTTDALIRRAFAGYSGRPVPVEMPPPVQIRGLLNRGTLDVPAAADSSFVRGVPASYARRDVVGLLPSHQPAIVTPPPVDSSFVRGMKPRGVARLDPATGKWRVTYSGEGR